ncbi:MAG: putative baseplate assembly protein [Bacteroidota bacterium]
MVFHCCNESRKHLVSAHPTLNGIDFLEVADDAQTTLEVHFLKPLLPGSLDETNVFIEGGDRIKNIRVLDATDGILLSPSGDSKVLTVQVEAPGDFSDYNLRLATSDNNPAPPAGFDQVLSFIVFSFKVACQNEFDCQPACDCPPETAVPPPDINYLAKDYTTFRRLMLDRMALLVPAWKERNPADLGIVLVELLAYVADYLSYRQDAIAPEAYLRTARKRSSVRRHARLVDYRMHDGCNARTWVQIQIKPSADGATLERINGNNTTKFLTRVEGIPEVIGAGDEAFKKALATRPKVFELMHDIELYSAHNEMNFYTWGNESCCLPRGATHATLKGHFDKLKEGDFLILAENRGTSSGEPEDANPLRRHVVRLTKIQLSEDELVEEELSGGSPGSPLGSPAVSSPASPVTSPANPSTGSFFQKVTEIYWDEPDALPFPLCISTEGLEDVSVAWGNIALVDHGMTFEDTGDFRSLSPSVVKRRNLPFVTADESCSCEEKAPAKAVPLRFRPKLTAAPLTVSDLRHFNEDHELMPVPAAVLTQQDCSKALPVISLFETTGSQRAWEPQRDLLSSGANKLEFVVETESDGTSILRFGDNKLGAQPDDDTDFIASFRIGNGSQGNIGAGTLAHLVPAVSTSLAVLSITNPLPAQGGTNPESMEQVRQFAPQAFRTQERAVTSADYEDFAKKSHPDVQKAAATLRWTGSWRTFFLTVDRMGGLDVDASFEQELRGRLEPYRLAGFDLEVDSPLFVPLEIEMAVCVQPGFFASEVKKALLDIFSKRVMPNSSTGIFHPDHFSFGQAVYLSRLYAAAQAVAGVASVEITKFERQGTPDSQPLQEGVLRLGRREIARCDNDRNFPDRGVFKLVMKGGK